MDQLNYTKIWQQNINKSHILQHNLISNNYLVSQEVSILALQEPSIDKDGYTLMLRDWVTVYPTTYQKPNIVTRAATLIWVSFNLDNWKQLDFPSGDVVVTQTQGDWGKLTLVNIYNDCNNNDTICLLTEFHSRCYDPPQFFSSISVTPATIPLPAAPAPVPPPTVQPIPVQPVAPPQPYIRT